MLPTNAIAFKEWAAICSALADGKQTILIRKGGIHEGRDGFRVAHHEFWLFPTYLHEATAGLTPDAQPLLERALAERPSVGTLHLTHYAVVTDVFEIGDEMRLASLAGQHVWSPTTVSDRFHYRHPGVYALVLRIHSRQQPIAIPDSPHFAGCRSWVELPQGLSTEGLRPVLSEQEFFLRRQAVIDALTTPVVT